MKKLFLIILVLILPVSSNGQQIGGLGIGWTVYAGDGSGLNYINDNGFCLVGLVPVHTPGVDAGIKLKLAHFSNSGKYPVLKEFQFANISNEILFGKKCSLGNIDILPQLGYGIRAESLYTDWDIGTFNLDAFWDFSLWLTRNFRTLDFGLLINYEADLKTIGESLKSGRRFNLAFVISK